jgi:hypothetical protein
MKSSDLGFNLELTGEVVEFGAEVYRRLAMGESCDGIEHEILARITALTQSCFDMPIEKTGEVQSCGEKERIIYTGNHPTYETQWITIQAMTDLAANGAAVGKSELLWQPWYLPPFLAWPAKLSGKAMFVPRNDHQKAVHVIKEACQRMFRPNTGVILFTDKHRPTQEAIKNDREKFSKIYPSHGIEDWLKYTCFPSSPGLMQVLDGVPDARVVDFTSGLNKSTPHGATFYIHQEEIPQAVIFDPSNIVDAVQTGKPVSDRELMVRGWLLKRYEWKNKWLHERQQR